MTWEEYSKKPGIVPCVRDADGLVVALCVGYSDEELQELCKKTSRVVHIILQRVKGGKNREI